jgi:hypothetical protein
VKVAKRLTRQNIVYHVPVPCAERAAKVRYRLILDLTIIRAVLASGAVGFVFLIALTYSISSVKAVSASAALVALIVQDVLGGVVQKLFLIFVCVSIFACGLIIMVTNHRTAPR